MVIYFAGPAEHMREALAASRYHCTRPAMELEEAEAFVLVWDGQDPEVKELMDMPVNGKPRYVHRISFD